MFADDVERLLRQPRACLVEGLRAGQHFAPFDAALAVIGRLDGGIEYQLRSAPDVAAHTVAFNEWNNWFVWNDKFAVGYLNRASHDFSVISNSTVRAGYSTSSAGCSTSPRSAMNFIPYSKPLSKACRLSC